MLKCAVGHGTLKSSAVINQHQQLQKAAQQLLEFASQTQSGEFIHAPCQISM